MEDAVKDAYKTVINGNNIDFFYEGLALASKYYNKLGNLAVSICCITTKGRTLGLWIEECRHTIDILSYSQISDLLSMGFYIESDILDHQKNWMQCYKVVKTLYSVERDKIIIPENIEELNNTFGFNIIEWIESQKKYRHMHSNMYLTARQIDLLNELKYDWGEGFDTESNDSVILKHNMFLEIEAVKEELKRIRQVNKRHSLDFYREKCEKYESWNNQLAKLLKIDNGIEACDEEMYNWILGSFERNSGLSKDQKQILSLLGVKMPLPDKFLPDNLKIKRYIVAEDTTSSKRKDRSKLVDEITYRNGIELCKEYMKNGRKFLVEPHGAAKDEKDAALKLFLSNIRQAYSKGLLNSSKVEELNNLNMVWDRQLDNGDYISYFWMAMYLEHKEYFKENGKIIARLSNLVSSDGRKMSTWLSSQKRAYTNGKLNRTQITLLKEINILKNSN